MMLELFEQAKEMMQELVNWRRSLHQNPELGLSLPQTSAFVQKQLDEMGIAYKTLVNGSAVLAQVGPEEGRCFMLRSDMDALPIQEETGLPFSSHNPGRMHACGHDLHTVILLGAAKLLKMHEQQRPGKAALPAGRRNLCRSESLHRRGSFGKPKGGGGLCDARCLSAAHRHDRYRHSGDVLRLRVPN